MRDGKLAHKISHVAHTRTPEGVNTLVVVTHCNYRAALHRWQLTLCALPGQHFDPRVLQLVGVLKLVNQNVPESPLVVITYRCVVSEQLVAAQHQFAKIHHAFALTLLFIQRINVNLFTHVFITRRHVFGPLAVFLATRNKVHQLLGRKTFVVNAELLAQPFDA